MAKRRITCIVEGCGKDATGGHRSMCTSCYSAAYRAVKAGEITWEELERRKLAGPDSRKDMAPRTAFGKALARKK